MLTKPSIQSREVWPSVFHGEKPRKDMHWHEVATFRQQNRIEGRSQFRSEVILLLRKINLLSELILSHIQDR